MPRLLLALAIVCGIQGIRLLILDRTVPGFLRGGDAFTISNVSAGSTIGQEFEAAARGLDSVAVHGVVSGAGRGYMDAVLFEMWNAGERQVRRASIELNSDSPACCVWTFEPVNNSNDRSYRLELTTRDFGPDLRLGFRAVPVRDEGGLTVNGHPQRANLVLDAGGTPLARMKGEPRISLWFLIACFTVIDAATACVIYILWRRVTAPATSSSPQPG